jgi:tetratricopeptide (TPR) repeat protein
MTESPPAEADERETRWERVLLAEALGEPISEADRSFLLECAKEPRYAAELELQAELGRALPAAKPSSAGAFRALRVLANWENGRTRRRRALVSSASLSLAAGVALAVFGRTTARDTPSVAAHASAPLARMVESSGEVLIDGAPPREGETSLAGRVLSTRSGRACVRWDEKVLACLAEHTALELPSTARASLSLQKGRLELHAAPLAPGSSFSIATAYGTASVVGTHFSVLVDLQAHFTEVAVSSGKVRTFDFAKKLERLLSAGETQRMGPGGSAPAASTPERPPAALETREATQSHKAEPASASATAHTKSAPELLNDARALRAASRYGAAAERYRQLLREHPRSAEARAALVSLGQLELSQLGRAEAALELFERYLTVQGPLAQEARYGKIQALARLGREAQERSEIQAFLRDHRQSPLAPDLRARLAALAP